MPRVSFGGNPDGVNLDRNACHVSWGGVPTTMDFCVIHSFVLLILPMFP